MKSTDKIKAASDRLKKVKDDLLSEILEDDSLSKVEKLGAICENDLWPVSDWVDHVFTDWEKECIENERQAAIADGKDPEKDYICTITDCYFIINEFFYDRHATVYYLDAIERLLESDSDKVVVARNRGEYHSVVEKTPQEVIDRICDFCFENKVIGCVVDW